MISWESEGITSPPFLQKYSNTAVKKFEEEPPNNSQRVERYIQLITKNATRAATPKLQDGLCKATIKNCKKWPSLETKSDFAK